MCRTVARRAERAVVALQQAGHARRARQYLNRLSGLLFVLARAQPHGQRQLEDAGRASAWRQADDATEYIASGALLNKRRARGLDLPTSAALPW